MTVYNHISSDYAIATAITQITALCYYGMLNVLCPFVYFNFVTQINSPNLNECSYIIVAGNVTVVRK